MQLPLWAVEDAVARALAEDAGRGDLTTRAVIDGPTSARGLLIAKQAGVIAGAGVAEKAFHSVDPTLDVQILCRDGTAVVPGDEVLRVEGAAGPMLTAERTALNFIQRLSGIATATQDAVRAAAGTDAMIVDTRKTTPGLRVLEKYAVRMGGGRNHRYGLDDAVMIKDNHIAVAGGITEAVRRARAHVGHMHKIQVEATTIAQVQEAAAAGADAVLLDNMDASTMRRAAALVDGRMIVEASGGIHPRDVAAVAQTGVDVISLGWITHSAPAMDLSFSMTIKPSPGP